MPGCIVSATTASFRSVEKRRRRATPVITSTFENVSDIGVCLGLYLGPPAKAGVRSKQGAVQDGIRRAFRAAGAVLDEPRWAILDFIESAPWTTHKCEAIDPKSYFWWIDENPTTHFGRAVARIG